MRVMCVVGARPNFMKIAPIMAALAKAPDAEAVLVHTGQHYDEKMSSVFFSELGIPDPDINLGVGSASHAVQTAKIMEAFEQVLNQRKPDVVVVVGDVNSTVACTLTAVKMGVKVAHVEAGLRSRDRAMPEEINRIVTDAISDFLFVTERDAISNLAAEGIPGERIYFVGNVMIDTLLRQKEKAAQSSILETLGVSAGTYGLLTLHRPSNVDSRDTLSRLLGAIEDVAKDLRIVWPVHPRTRSRLEQWDLWPRVEANPRFALCAPAGYMDFTRLMSEAALVLTDSGEFRKRRLFWGCPVLPCVRTPSDRSRFLKERTCSSGPTPPPLCARRDAHCARGATGMCLNCGTERRLPEL